MFRFGRTGGLIARFCITALACALVLFALMGFSFWRSADKTRVFGDLVERLVTTEGLAQAEALDAVVVAAESADAEALETLLELLEEYYNVESRRSNWLPAEEALEKLAASKRPDVSVGARGVFQRSRDLRSQRALSEVERLGGRARFNPMDGNLVSIQLSEKWTGGDQGLAHIGRLAGLSTLYVTPGAAVSKAALDELHTARPGLSILPRGEGYLGIWGVQYPTFFQIDSVDPNSAGERGGVLPGDIVREFDGRSIADFDSLSVRLAGMKPGDRVTMRVARKGELIDLPLVVGVEPSEGEQQASR